MSNIFKCCRCKELKEFRLFKTGKKRQYCIDCTRVVWREWASKPESKKKISLKSKNWRLKNPDRVKEKNKYWATVNAEKARLNTAQWRKDNPERALAAREAWNKAHLEKVKTMHRANCRRWQAAKLRRCPNWLSTEDRVAIQGFYAVAGLYTRESGEAWHVDHKIPLQGKTVCGLHVPWSLRVIRGIDNSRKHNKLLDL